MRKFWLYLLKRSLLCIVNCFSAAPKKEIVFKSLSYLFAFCANDDNSNRIKVPAADAETAKITVFSDQNKGDKSGSDSIMLQIFFAKHIQYFFLRFI